MKNGKPKGNMKVGQILEVAKNDFLVVCKNKKFKQFKTKHKAENFVRWYLPAILKNDLQELKSRKFKLLSNKLNRLN